MKKNVPNGIQRDLNSGLCDSREPLFSCLQICLLGDHRPPFSSTAYTHFSAAVFLPTVLSTGLKGMLFGVKNAALLGCVVYCDGSGHLHLSVSCTVLPTSLQKDTCKKQQFAKPGQARV